MPTDKHLVNQGAYPHEFMVIETGTAEVSHDGKHLADLGPGDFFGEMALLLNVPRTATVAATSEVTLVVMHERNFRAMEEEIPAIAERVNAIMEERRAKSAEQGIETPEAKGSARRGRGPCARAWRQGSSVRTLTSRQTASIVCQNPDGWLGRRRPLTEAPTP